MANKILLLAGAAIGVAVIAKYAGKKALTAINPADQDNLANTVFNHVYDSSGETSLGTDIYQWLNPNEGFNERGEFVNDVTIPTLRPYSEVVDEIPEDFRTGLLGFTLDFGRGIF